MHISFVKFRFVYLLHKFELAECTLKLINIALQLLHKKIAERESVEFYNERFHALAASYPEELMKQYPEEAKKYKIQVNMASALSRTKRIADALKILDEMEAIQNHVTASENAKRKAEAEARRKAAEAEEAKRLAEEEQKRKEREKEEEQRLASDMCFASPEL